MAEVRSLRKITAQRAPDGADEVFIFGCIGDPWAFDVPSFLQWVAYTKPTTIRFVVMSPGGFAFDALNAVDFIKGQGITCYVEIVGECMSAATFFAALAGPDRTEITESGSFGIHKASGPIGDREFTAHVDERMRKLYSSAYGWTEAKMDKLLEGTGTMWLGQDAVDAGIASAIMDQKKVAARNVSVEHFKNTQSIVMSDKKIKVKGKLLNTIALVGNEVEVEIEATEEQATAADELAKATADRQAAETAKAEADAAVEAAKQREADLTAQLAAKETERATAAEEAVTAKQEAEGLKAQVTAKDAELVKANGVIAELRKLPTADRINNARTAAVQEPANDNATPSEGQVFVNEVFAQMTDVQRAMHTAELKRRKATQAKA